MPGADAYATSKQCNLATVMAFASTVTLQRAPNRVLLRIPASGARPTSSCASWQTAFFRCSLPISSIGAPQRKPRAWPPTLHPVRPASTTTMEATRCSAQNSYGNPRFTARVVAETKLCELIDCRTRSVTPIDSPNYLAPSFPSYLSYHSNDQGA